MTKPTTPASTTQGEPENPPAFPSSSGDPQNPGWVGGGMTLRDWFAGQVMAQCFSEHHGNDWGRAGVKHAPISAEQAYRFADAMLKARRGVS